MAGGTRRAPSKTSRRARSLQDRHHLRLPRHPGTGASMAGQIESTTALFPSTALASGPGRGGNGTRYWSAGCGSFHVASDPVTAAGRCTTPTVSPPGRAQPPRDQCSSGTPSAQRPTPQSPRTDVSPAGRCSPSANAVTGLPAHRSNGILLQGAR
ncbi:hypothetical protein NDU88_004234 [Pleurodeles waltl]|uniref:Uncharacterized protein n=1 Tax=Pleurodeles waltl TaxID=8319 RepID=A0AAV7SI66_PLEWA|nr:hypothetical protein NDU88_004234 [Pleurodeles waltl]